MLPSADDTESENNLKHPAYNRKKDYTSLEWKLVGKNWSAYGIGLLHSMVDIQLRGVNLRQVRTFRDRGSTISKDGRPSVDIKSRKVLAKWMAFLKKKMLISRNNYIEQESLVKSFVCMFRRTGYGDARYLVADVSEQWWSIQKVVEWRRVWKNVVREKRRCLGHIGIRVIWLKC